MRQASVRGRHEGIDYLSAALSLAASASAALPRNDFLLRLDRRAGPYHYLDAFEKGHPRSYEAALAAFGTPSSFRVQGNLCRVTWAEAGITIGFASQLSPCAAGHLFQAAWYGMSLTDRRWHNQLGLRVGMPLARGSARSSHNSRRSSPR